MVAVERSVLFWSVQCNGCGRYQTCQTHCPSSYVFNCRRCGKRTKLKDKKHLDFTLNVIGPFHVERECAATTAKKNGERNE